MFIVFEHDYDYGHSVIGVCSTLEGAKGVTGADKIEVWSGLEKIATYEVYNGAWSKYTR